MSRFKSLCVALAAGLLLAGCAGTRSLVPGSSTAEDVRAALGEPAKVWDDGGGAQSWEYPGGYAGLESWMIRLDPQGVVKAADQVRDDRFFGRVTVGQQGQEDVRRILGAPSEITRFDRRGQTVWDYRYREVLRVARFHVVFNEQGQVVDTLRTIEHLGDSKERP